MQPREIEHEHEYGKGQHYNEYYNDDLGLVKTDGNSCSESEAESHKDSVPHKMFFAKVKNILVSFEKLSTFVNSFTVCKFCNNPIRVKKDNKKSVSLVCFFKIVCQNEKCLKIKMSSSVNMPNENDQFFEINCLFVLFDLCIV